MIPIPPEETVQVETPLGELTLWIGMSAWQEYQRRTGFSILATPITSVHLEDTERCMLLLWLAVREHHPEITEEQLARRLTLRDLDRIRPRLIDAIKATSPELPPDEEGGDEDPPPAQG